MHHFFEWNPGEAKLSELETIKMAEVVVLVIDAEEPLDKQELDLARHVEEEGRALVIAVNKWDLIEDKQKYLKELIAKVTDGLAQVLAGDPIGIGDDLEAAERVSGRLRLAEARPSRADDHPLGHPPGQHARERRGQEPLRFRELSDRRRLRQ